jgi:hypothetical protein
LHPVESVTRWDGATAAVKHSQQFSLNLHKNLTADDLSTLSALSQVHACRTQSGGLFVVRHVRSTDYV